MEEPINTPEKLNIELILNVLIWVRSKNSEITIVLKIVQKTFISNFLSSSVSRPLSKISSKNNPNSESFLFNCRLLLLLPLLLLFTLRLIFSTFGKLYPSFFIWKCFVSSFEASTSEIVSNFASKWYLLLFSSSFFPVLILLIIQ